MRRQAIKDVHKSRHIHLKGKLAGFTNGMYHLLPPGQSLEFKFSKGNSRFYIIKSEDNAKQYKVQIISAFLHLTRVQLHDKVNEQFMARWKREGIYLMPFCRGDVHQHVITPKVHINATLCFINHKLLKVLSHTIANVNLARVPYRITLLFTSQRVALGGVYTVSL